MTLHTVIVDNLFYKIRIAEQQHDKRPERPRFDPEFFTDTMYGRNNQKSGIKKEQYRQHEQVAQKTKNPVKYRRKTRIGKIPVQYMQNKESKDPQTEKEQPFTCE